MGSSEFLMALISDPESIHKLLRIINEDSKTWGVKFFPKTYIFQAKPFHTLSNNEEFGNKDAF